jgi:ribonuclease Y
VEPLSIVLGVVALALAIGCVVLARRAGSATAAAAVSETRLRGMEQNLDERVAQLKKQADAELKAASGTAREEAERQTESARQRLAEDERRIRERDGELERRAQRAERREEDLGRRESRIGVQEKELEERGTRLTSLQDEAVQAIERVAGLSRDEARKQLLDRIEEDTRKLAARRVKEIEDEVRDRSEQTAKNIISMAIQRYAGEYVCERTVSVVPIPSDEVKGRIIGREGRNIRALEAATGVDFIIDDTPDCIVISAFNPIRREVAKAALLALLDDGRIHPSRIEQVVKKAEADFARVIKSAGDEAANEVGIGGIHPEILKLVGALKYRTSYGQNQWQHAIEVSFLSGMMANELGLDVKRAKRAGLLHDIGKVMDQTAEGSHALIGAEFARKHGEANVIVNAIAAHHEEVPQETVYACLAQAADAISGARPGARREMMQTYTQRLQDLERISNSFPGVERSYAVQAGREVRILVENSQISDEEAVLMSRDIAQKIENEMAYPGQIKVTVIRETRVVQYAR